MLTAITVLTALVCVLMMVVVLIQNPKGGGIDSTFGGGGANQMLGAAKQVDFIERLTWYLAIALFTLCIISAIYVSGIAPADAAGGSSVPLQTEQ